MTGPREPLFLERQNYRRRRLADALRLLPVLGALLFLLPILGTSDRTASTALGGIYVFLVWFLLIVAALLLSRRVRAGEAEAAGERDAGSD